MKLLSLMLTSLLAFFLVTRVRREHERAQFDSGHPDVWPGVVTEACRSDTAAAVVRLHLGPFHVGTETRDDHTGSWCNGSTADF